MRPVEARNEKEAIREAGPKASSLPRAGVGFGSYNMRKAPVLEQKWAPVKQETKTNFDCSLTLA